MVIMSRTALLSRTVPRLVPSITIAGRVRLGSTSAASAPPIKLKNKDLWRTSGLLNGQWTSGGSSSQGSFNVYNPATEEQLGQVAEMGIKETKEAIQIAHDTFYSKEWSGLNEYQRGALLQKLFQLMKENSEDLAQIITAENGKPLTDARGEVAYGSSFIEWYAGEAIRNYGDVVPSSVPGVTNFVIKQPVGVCGIITPWNFPNAMVTRKLGAALAAGCTVVIKAPAETPYSVLAIAELCQKAGIPDGVVNVVTTEKNVQEVGKEICENGLVKKVSFTGSTRVGKILMKQSSDTLKKLSMELGGNAPFIVFDDADIEKAVAGAVVSKFRLSGQTCVCANRIFVQDGIYDKFANALTKAVSSFKVGNGATPGVTHGPVIHHNALSKVSSHFDSALKSGAKTLIGGRRKEGKGFFWEPTVLRDVGRCEIDDEETFGPLAPLYRFGTEEEVLKVANEPRVGLAGYFFSENPARISRVSAALQVGMVGANTGAISQAGIPFGGVGESGFGREGSKYGLAEYQNIKFVALGGMP